MGNPWYKRYPSDFIAGTLRLTLEEKGAYSVIIDLLHEHDGRLPDDPRYIAGVCGCSVRKWNALRERLIDMGKITASDGVISNFRVDKDIENERKYREERAESGRKGGEKSAEKKAERKENNNLDQAELKHARAFQKPEEEYKNPPIVPPKDAIEVWNEVCGDVLPKVQKLHEARKRSLAKRLSEDFGNDLSRWREYCEQIRASAFLTGENPRSWRADFDWALKTSNLAKVIEGKYGSGVRSKPPDPDAAIRRIAPLWQRIYDKHGKGYTPKPSALEVRTAFTIGVIDAGCAKANGLEVQ